MKSRSFSESHSIPYNKFRALGFLEAPFNLVRLGAGDVAYDDFGKITVVHTVLRPRLMFSLTGKASPPMAESLALKHKLALWFRARHGLRSKAKPARDTMFRAGEVSPAFTKRRWVDI
jgi:hypothetical protein